RESELGDGDKRTGTRLKAHKVANLTAQAEADLEQEDPLSDAEGDIYEIMGDDGEVFFARLAAGPISDSNKEANVAVASAMMAKTVVAIASQAAVAVPDWTETELDDFSATHVPEKAVKWILDSGATHHMTSRSELLPMRVTATEDAVVHIADGTRAKIERRGACLASMYGDGGTEAKATLLKTVLVVPSFTNNLLSVQRLAEEGWTVKFARSGAELISPKGEKVQTFTEPGTGAPYVMLRSQPVRYIDIKGSAKRIRMGPAKATARAATVDDSKLKEQATLWHKRLGHPSYYTLRILAGSPTFARVDRPSPRIFAQIIAEEEQCDPCIETKQPLLPFGDSETEPEAKMSDISFDLMGPFEGNKEHKYAFNILDSWSRMTWCFPIPNKEAATVTAVFKEWATLMKNHGHGSIKRVHCDHGGEFENHLLQKWVSSNGIQ
ncbi:hypothetical protein CF335_g8690, partial [Tilletia laevis]